MMLTNSIFNPILKKLDSEFVLKIKTKNHLNILFWKYILFCFSTSNINCSKIQEEIAVFDTLFQIINFELNKTLSLKYKSLTYSDATLYSNFISQKPEKDFLNLIAMQGRNNVSEVIVVFNR